jgi:hypothetical protein
MFPSTFNTITAAAFVAGFDTACSAAVKDAIARHTGDSPLMVRTVADAEKALGRPLRDGEADRISQALVYSTVFEAWDIVLDQFRDAAEDAHQCERCGKYVQEDHFDSGCDLRDDCTDYNSSRVVL